MLSLLLQLGACTLWGEGAHSSSLFFCAFAALKDSECGILMPSDLLVWQIPNREMTSRAESQYPPWESLALSCAV